MPEKIFQLVDALQPGENIVSMITFQNQIFIATTKNVYVLKGNKIYPLELIEKKGKEDAEVQ